MFYVLLCGFQFTLIHTFHVPCSCCVFFTALGFFMGISLKTGKKYFIAIFWDNATIIRTGLPHLSLMMSIFLEKENAHFGTKDVKLNYPFHNYYYTWVLATIYLWLMVIHFISPTEMKSRDCSFLLAVFFTAVFSTDAAVLPPSPARLWKCGVSSHAF